ncbi:MAG: helix-turn-helix transcriptional regulator [Synergistaceae bacterium]
MAKKTNSTETNATEQDYTEVYLIRKLIDARIAKGLTQEQLANIVDMKQSAVARLETLGSRPRIDTMIKLLKPLGYALEVVPVGAEIPVIGTKAVAESKPKKEIKKSTEVKKPTKVTTPDKTTPSGKGIQLPPKKKEIRRQQDDFSVDWD